MWLKYERTQGLQKHKMPTFHYVDCAVLLGLKNKNRQTEIGLFYLKMCEMITL